MQKTNCYYTVTADRSILFVSITGLANITSNCLVFVCFEGTINVFIIFSSTTYSPLQQNKQIDFI